MAAYEDDSERRRLAAYIQWQKQDAWLVVWGPYTRRFWAYARWPLPPGGAVVSGQDADTLYAEMRRVERENGFLRWRHGWFTGE
ncbi:hypothetical protein [Halostreptopolyspora alba]|uniref:Uncharacterized protein n=1 Tax=Halostreptopolyspora alba TaxID=2487137 RepID=A0A3N0EB80_9ACTN|nr:hypothetical protein EFW17_10405 [Nocardiopsaceae bacterium YIM 96095]